MNKVIKQVVEYYSGRLPNVFSASERFFTDGNNIVDRAQVHGKHILCTVDEYLKVAEDVGYGGKIAKGKAEWEPKVGELARCNGWYVPIKITFLGESMFMAEKTDLSINKEVCGLISELRPLKSEREFFIEKALAGMLTKKISRAQLKTINRMYDLGFKAPE